MIGGEEMTNQIIAKLLHFFWHLTTDVSGYMIYSESCLDFILQSDE